MEEVIQQSCFQHINSLNNSLRKFSTQQPAINEVPLQIMLHMITCASAMRDMLEEQQQVNTSSGKSGLHVQIFNPFLNGFLATVGKLVMDAFTYEPKFQEAEKFTGSYNLLVHHTLRLFPEMTTRKHKSSGKLLLHHAVFKARHGIAEELIKTILTVSPNSATIPDNTGALPLHWATRNSEISVDLIELLIDAFPESVSYADQKGFLPLHWAVNQDNANVEVVRKLLKINPAAASIATQSGSLALHYCVSREKPQVSVIKALLNASPDSIRKKCAEGFLPLHRYVHRSPVDNEVLRLLIQYYPEGLSSLSMRKQSPLHVALDFPSQDTTALAIMINEEPGVCKLADVDGYYPLHLVLDNFHPDYVVAQKILNCYPEAARMKTAEGMLALHLAISVNETPFLPFVTALLEANPDAMNQDVNDIVPAIDGVALVDPETWSGEWVERKWNPVERARERGLVEIINLFQQFPKLLTAKKAGSTPGSATASIKQSQPLKVISELQTPPRKFVLTSMLNEEDEISSVQSQSNNNPPEVRRQLSLEPIPVKKNDSSPPAATTKPAANTPVAEPQPMVSVNKKSPRLPPMNKPISSPALVVEQIEEPAESSEPAVVLVDNYIADDEKTREKREPPAAAAPLILTGNNRAPPTGPIPTSLLQAAETNAMRLSKAQYDFLKNGKVNKKAIRNAKAASKLMNANNQNNDTGGESDTNNNYTSDEGGMVNSAVRVKKIPPNLIRKGSNNNFEDSNNSNANLAKGQNTNNTVEIMKGLGKNRVHPVGSVSSNNNDAIDMV